VLRKIQTGLLVLLINLVSYTAHAQTAITVGDLEVDPPTLAALGFALPITAGDTNYNAQAQLHYKPLGSGTWLRAMDLMRVRPEHSDTWSRRKEFAGSIMGLTPGTAYDVRVTVTDPDGGGVTRTVTTQTRGFPPKDPATPRQVRVTTFAELKAAVWSAAPGDVITLAPGTYSGNLVIERSGTAANPIFLRGADRATSVIEALTGKGIDIFGDYITIENLTVRGNMINSGLPAGSAAIQISTDQKVHTDIVIRDCLIIGKDQGIKAWEVFGKNFTIYNNVLAGNNLWSDTDKANSTWDDEGIAISGSGHAVFNNTLYGYGDALGNVNGGNDPIHNNIAQDFYHNDVIFTGDDGLELDESFRNVRAWENRILNSNHGVAEQSNNTDHGGPTYFIRNVLTNTRIGPIKLNDGTSGVYFLHNTAIRTSEWAYVSYNNGGHANYRAINNIMINTRPITAGGKTFVHEALIDFGTSELTYFGFYPNQSYWFGANGVNGAKDVTLLSEVLNQDMPLLKYSRVLTLPIFQTDFQTGPDYRTMVDPSKQSVDVTLHSTSNAVDAGRVIAGLNEDFAGAAPDLGAYERGKAIPSYGASFSTFSNVRRPRAPMILSAK